MSHMKPGKKPLESKVCPVCGIDKPRSEYYKKAHTISHKCKPCTLADVRSRAPQYFGKYSEYQNQWRRERYATDEEYRARVSDQKKAIWAANQEAVNAARRHRWANDPHYPARKYYRRKDVKDRTPQWVDLNDILEIYANCPKGMVVDHIVPLKGKIDGMPVTGLHVPWNLQYLSKAQNLKKNCRISMKELEPLFVKR